MGVAGEAARRHDGRRRWRRPCWRRPAPRPSRRGHPLERLFRDARCGSLQPATSDVCADWLGIAALGGDPRPRRGRRPDGEPGGGRPGIAGGRRRRIRPARPRRSCGRLLLPLLRRVARGLAKRIFANSGVRTRHGVVNPLLEDSSEWPTERADARYLVEAMPLGKEAVGRALSAAGVPAERHRHVRRSAPAPGTSRPGLDILLARDLGMPAGRAAALRRSHGLLRGAAGAGRGRATTSPLAAGRRCCSAWS